MNQRRNRDRRTVLFGLLFAVLTPLFCSGSRAVNLPPVVAKPIPDVVVRTDSVFEFDLNAVGTVMFGYDTGGKNLQATNNYFASSVRFFKAWQDVVFQDNTVVCQSTTSVQFDQHPDQLLKGYRWENNVYVTHDDRPFQIAGSRQSLREWQSNTGLGEGGVSTNKAANLVEVRPNSYNPGRAHVIVFNWQREDEVQVDLSEVVPAGARFRIHHVLALDGPPIVKGIYGGGVVTISMEETPTPTPIGHRPPAVLTLDKEFGTFLVLADLPETDDEDTHSSFFVTPSGSNTGDGSVTAPWDLETALSHPDSVKPGDTIWLQGGTYTGRLISRLQGTKSAPIRVRALPGQNARIDLAIGATSQRRRFTINGQHTWYQDLEIFSSDDSDRVSQLAGSWPSDINRGEFSVLGDHIKLINLQIHDLNNGIGYWSSGAGGEVYGCLIYNNGWIGPDRQHGHAIYSQNSGSRREFRENVLFNQFRNGIKIYGTEHANLKDYLLEGNVSFNNGGHSEGFTGTFQYLVGGGSLAENIVVRNNYAYVGKSYFADPGDKLTYSARRLGGQRLPSWLKLDAEGLFEGRPSHSDVGSIELEVTATDSAGASVLDRFTITVIADAAKDQSELSD